MKRSLLTPVVRYPIAIRLTPASSKKSEPEPRKFGNNGIITTPKDVGGWPEFKSLSQPPADTDKDGMPDEWEKAHGLDPNDAADGTKDRDGDGYTNIEEYINGLVK